MVKQSFSAQSGNCLSLINFKQILTIQSADPFVPFIPSTSESFPNISSFRTICGPNSYSRQSSWAKSCEFSWAWIHLICVLRPNVWTSNSSNAFRLNTRKLQRYDYKQKDVFPCFCLWPGEVAILSPQKPGVQRRKWHHLVFDRGIGWCQWTVASSILKTYLVADFSEIASNASHKPICFDLFGIPSLWGNSIDLQHFDSEIRDHSAPSWSPKSRQKCIWCSSKCRAFSVKTPRKFWYLNFDEIPVKLFHALPRSGGLVTEIDICFNTFTTSLVSLCRLPCSLLSELRAFVANQKRSASCLLCGNGEATRVTFSFTNHGSMSGGQAWLPSCNLLRSWAL